MMARVEPGLKPGAGQQGREGGSWGEQVGQGAAACQVLQHNCAWACSCLQSSGVMWKSMRPVESSCATHHTSRTTAGRRRAG